MLLPQDREQLRRYFCEVWHKAGQALPLEPLEQIMVEVIRQHPEYHAVLADPDRALTSDYSPAVGETNPFLHLSMHIAIQEQLRSNRPSGIVGLYQRLCQRFGDSHAAEHQMLECLGETLWEAQRAGMLPDENRYRQRLERLLLTD